MLRIQTHLAERYRTASAVELDTMIAAAKETLGEKLLILGHHYQREEVMKWADAKGDSFKLAQISKSNPKANYIVFCGVHFMAESADILTNDNQKVILPDLNAGCSMADMADISEVEFAWEQLEKITNIDKLIPITYMNSAANLKAFVAEKGGAVCTSTNAEAILKWSLSPTGASGEQIFFFPDQHLGRNTAHQMGHPAKDMALWDPHKDLGGLSETQCKEALFLLWKGHCSVHQRFTPEQIMDFRKENPEGLVVVHPECSRETVELADEVGSTELIIKYINSAPVDSKIAVGTEIHLVQRLARENPDKEITSLDPLICPCSTMFRIDAPHLAWVLENLVNDRVVNQIQVEPDIADSARLALERMLEIS